MFKGQPKGLFALALANTGERFGYYTMLAVFALFLRANFGLEAGVAGAIYSTFLGLVYFMPLIGGIMADKFGYGKMVTIGIFVMFAGYLLLSLPLGSDTIAMIVMLAALLFIPSPIARPPPPFPHAKATQSNVNAFRQACKPTEGQKPSRRTAYPSTNPCTSKAAHP